MSIRRVLIGLHAAALFIAVSTLFVPWNTFQPAGGFGVHTVILISDLYVLDLGVYRFGYAVMSLLSGLGAMMCAPPNKESYVLAVTTVLSFMLFCM